MLIKVWRCLFFCGLSLDVGSIPVGVCVLLLLIECSRLVSTPNPRKTISLTCIFWMMTCCRLIIALKVASIWMGCELILRFCWRTSFFHSGEKFYWRVARDTVVISVWQASSLSSFTFSGLQFVVVFEWNWTGNRTCSHELSNRVS